MHEHPVWRDYLLLSDRYGWSENLRFDRCGGGGGGGVFVHFSNLITEPHFSLENLRFIRYRRGGGGGGGSFTSQTSRLFDSSKAFEEYP